MMRAGIVCTEPNCRDSLTSSPLHVPEIHKLLTSTNIETKKTRVVQSIF